MKINYDLLMENKLKEIKKAGSKPRLLLHSCCAPCSCAVIEHLLEYFDITIYFYNPNITFEEEYKLRLDEQREYLNLKEYNIDVLEGNYDPKNEFFDAIKGLEKEREGGKRCFKCYGLRLEETARKAKEENYDFFCSVLSISPMKNSQWINEIGNELAEKYGVEFLNADFKKKSRYLRSIEISREFDLYRQDYCGCVFSKIEREEYTAQKNK